MVFKLIVLTTFMTIYQRESVLGVDCKQINEGETNVTFVPTTAGVPPSTTKILEIETEPYENQQQFIQKQPPVRREELLIFKEGMDKALDDTLQSNTDLEFEAKARTDGYTLSNPEDAPYCVFLYIHHVVSKLGYVCTGSLITPEWVLTAAHCHIALPADPLEIKVYAGISFPVKDTSTINGSQTSLVAEHKIHPKFKASRVDSNFDIMLLKTKTKFNMTKYVNTIPLSSQPWNYQGYKDCIFVGFGKVGDGIHEDDHKRKTHKLRLKKPCFCSWVYEDLMGFKKEFKKFICAEPKVDFGVCHGDSGGGLVCDGKVKAIAILGSHMSPSRFCQPEYTDTCGTGREISVFLDICPYLEWINSHAKVLSENEISDQCLNWQKYVDDQVEDRGIDQLSSLVFLITSLVVVFLCK